MLLAHALPMAHGHRLAPVMQPTPNICPPTPFIPASFDRLPSPVFAGYLPPRECTLPPLRQLALAPEDHVRDSPATSSLCRYYAVYATNGGPPHLHPSSPPALHHHFCGKWEEEDGEERLPAHAPRAASSDEEAPRASHAPATAKKQRKKPPPHKRCSGEPGSSFRAAKIGKKSRAADSAKRSRTTKEQLAILEHAFEQEMLPSVETRERLAKQLGFSSRRVQIWFQNKRAKLKKTKGKQIFIINCDAAAFFSGGDKHQ